MITNSDLISKPHIPYRIEYKTKLYDTEVTVENTHAYPVSIL